MWRDEKSEQFCRNLDEEKGKGREGVVTIIKKIYLENLLKEAKILVN